MSTVLPRSVAIAVLASATAMVTLAGCADMQNDFVRELLNPGINVASPAAGPLEDRTLSAGLKEALRVGIHRTIDATAKTDGYLGNERIRIPLPDQVDGKNSEPASACDGCQVRRFEISMNRAAEWAAGEAGGLFLDALKGVTIPGAANMVEGCNATATAYFRAQTSDALMERFRPIVSAQMADVGLYDLAKGLNLGDAVNLDEYVSRRALDGLFAVLAEEEIRIRQDPDARTTALLQRVFGNNGSTTTAERPTTSR